MTPRASRPQWTDTDIPDQSGRTVLVTGATAGLALRTATVLARHGARVLLGGRNPERASAAMEQVAAAATGAAPDVVTMDLADLGSVRKAAAAVRERTGDRLDVLVNNAGIMAPPLTFSVDGYESQWATNHLGHAALSWLLYPALQDTADARIVTVSSVAARVARRDSPATLATHARGEHYLAAGAYARSKLANLVFAIELHRRLQAAGSTVLSIAAHPGFSSTNLASGMNRGERNLIDRTTKFGIGLPGQSTERGGLPQLYAATAPGVHSGDYLGPSGLGQFRGAPTLLRASKAARDERLAAALWSLTAEQTGVEPQPG